jgi:hypothetical protein
MALFADRLPAGRGFASGDSVLREAVLADLKTQVPAGCVLCYLDSLDQEECD